MNLNPNLPDPNQTPHVAPSPPKLADTSKKWSQKEWLVRVYIPIAVPILAALIAGGYFAFKPSSSLIPVLHSSYTGTYSDLTIGTNGPLTLSGLSEDMATGAFTAAGTIGTSGGTCVDQITQGLVIADGKMTFVLTYQQSNACNAGTADCTGQLNSAGGITGTCNNVAIQDTVTYTLS
jgi:hypothetical protein